MWQLSAHKKAKPRGRLRKTEANEKRRRVWYVRYFGRKKSTAIRHIISHVWSTCVISILPPPVVCEQSELTVLIIRQ